MTPSRRTALVVVIATVVITIDQLAKTWAVNTLATRDIDLFWTLRFHLAKNRGPAFSLGLGSGGVIAILAIVIVIVFLVIGRSVDSKLGVLSLGLVLGGALGNLVDRAFREGSGFLGGGVIDFIDPQWWPIFNVADIAITVGGVLLVFTASSDRA
ncbi:MAG TPA: signal peptidase II [Acidimicrobiales bacterium]|nr:signal peptidase II [Acidimicrobiales bacterium]